MPGTSASAQNSCRKLALIALYVITACGCGSGGGDGAAVLTNQSSVAGIVVIPSLSGTYVAFTLISPDSHAMDVTLEFSEDRGRIFQRATVSHGSVARLATSPAGIRHEVVWSPLADLTITNQSDLTIRIGTRDVINGMAGAPAESEVFGLGTNSAPQVVLVTTPTGTQGGKIAIEYTVRDQDSDHIGLILHFSLDGGATWQEGTPADGGDGAWSVSTSAVAVARTVYWYAQIDAPNVVSSTARLRIIPVDIVNGTHGTSGNFAVDLRGPTLQLFTVGDIPATMNGSTPYPDDQGNLVAFQLAVPRSGWEFHVAFSPGGSPIDLASLHVSADRVLGEGFAAGTELGGQFTTTPTTALWQIGSSHTLPTGVTTFTASIEDEVGNISNTLAIAVVALDAGVSERPFDWVDTWYLNFAADQYGISSSFADSTVTVTVTAGGNGTADYLEDLKIIGLQTDDPTTECAEMDSNGLIHQYLLQETLGRLRILYGGDFDTEVNSFAPNLRFTTTQAGSTSAIRIGGDDSAPGYAIGRAGFDYRNAAGNSNESTSLGIFTTNLIEFYINSSFSFRTRFDPTTPGRGTPAGEDDLDHIILDPDFDRLDPANPFQQNLRYDEVWSAIDGWARSTSVVIAHEIGHSIGMCANGDPPSGLFGGVTGPAFSGPYTTPYHFDSPGHNVMAAALSFSASLNTGPTGYRFSELEQAYLREWMVLAF